jgi:hypothetical protein
MRIKVTSLAISYQKRGMGYRRKKGERIKEQKALVFKKRKRKKERVRKRMYPCPLKRS